MAAVCITKTKNMKKVKDILTENRETIVRSIIVTFLTKNDKELKDVMVRFLAFMEENFTAEYLMKVRGKKTFFKYWVGEMKSYQSTTKRPKLADTMSAITELHTDAGEVFHPIYKEWVKDENAFSSMVKS